MVLISTAESKARTFCSGALPHDRRRARASQSDLQQASNHIPWLFQHISPADFFLVYTQLKSADVLIMP